MVGPVDDRAENGQDEHQAKGNSSQGINFFDRMFAYQYVRGHGDDKAEGNHVNDGECFVIHNENVDIYILFGNLVDS